jgi:hypothetical protein
MSRQDATCWHRSGAGRGQSISPGRGQGSFNRETWGKRQRLRAREAVKRCARLRLPGATALPMPGALSCPHTGRARKDPSPPPSIPPAGQARARRLRAPCASTPGRGAGWGRQAAWWGPGPGKAGITRDMLRQRHYARDRFGIGCQWRQQPIKLRTSQQPPAQQRSRHTRHGRGVTGQGFICPGFHKPRDWRPMQAKGVKPIA